MPDQFLRDLLETPGTSGVEQSVQHVVRAFASKFAAEVTTDIHGNVLATVNPSGSPTILLDAHCDQIGLIVRHIDNLGFVRVNPVGGWDMQILLGQRLLIHTESGPIPGVIARKPIHLLDPDERKRRKRERSSGSAILSHRNPVCGNYAMDVFRVSQWTTAPASG